MRAQKELWQAVKEENEMGNPPLSLACPAFYNSLEALAWPGV